MKAIHNVNRKGQLYGWAFWCPACDGAHIMHTGPWSFNGNQERPTFTPSLLVYATKPTGQELPGYKLQKRCHLDITDGQIIYHGDSEHGMRGQTVPLVDWPEGEAFCKEPTT